MVEYDVLNSHLKVENESDNNSIYYKINKTNMKGVAESIPIGRCCLKYTHWKVLLKVYPLEGVA